MQPFDSSEILWDSWGVPHISANTETDLFRAMGWAQAKSHGAVLLTLYGQARGRAAEYWGPDYIDLDRYIRTMGISQRAKAWYQVQGDTIQGYLSAFSEGINIYLQAHPDQVPEDVQVVLPITGADVLAHIHRVIHYSFVVNPQHITDLEPPPPSGGSNAWAIAPSRSATQNALLLANPHQPWFDCFLWYEAQLTLPHVSAYGAALLGWPTLGIAFNDHMGWTVTVNPAKGADFYPLTLREGGYDWNGDLQPFEIETQILKIRQPNGTVQEESLTIIQSVHGPVVRQDGETAIALRVVGLDQPHLFAQLWEMVQATNLSQFEAALQRLQIPLFNFLYADRAGQIFYLFNAQVPQRPSDTDGQDPYESWQPNQLQDPSEPLWSQYHPYEDLPRIVNPPTGWLQSTNDPPWTATVPNELNPEDYPSYMAPRDLGQLPHNILRPQRSLRKLIESPTLHFEEMIEFKFSSHLELADRLLAPLCAAAKQVGGALIMQAVEVLEAWDQHANADSRGTVLFTQWAEKMETDLFATPWQWDAPLETPCGLANPERAIAILEEVATDLKDRYGTLDIAWGEVVRLRQGIYDLPASGAASLFGSFQVLNIMSDGNDRFQAIGGDSFIMAIEFGSPIRAEALTVYGNATQPDSPHTGDQLPLYTQGKLRPVWRERDEILAHLELHETWDPDAGSFVPGNP